MKHMTMRTLAGATGTAATLLCSAAAFSQTAPPSPSLQDTAGPPAWVGYLIMFLLFAVIIAVSLMPTKRSHQD